MRRVPESKEKNGYLRIDLRGLQIGARGIFAAALIQILLRREARGFEASITVEESEGQCWSCPIPFRGRLNSLLLSCPR